MAALTVQDCKDYLRIQHTAEDTMLALWLTMARASVIAELGRPIDTESHTWQDDAVTHRVYGVVCQLMIPVGPIDPDSLEITDVDGTALVVDEDYLTPPSAWAGVIPSAVGVPFANGPYTITADVGLELADNFATVIEPAINAAILDTVADRYERRNPNASQQSSGGGVSTSYTASGIPTRVAATLAPWKLLRV